MFFTKLITGPASFSRHLGAVKSMDQLTRNKSDSVEDTSNIWHQIMAHASSNATRVILSSK